MGQGRRRPIAMALALARLDRLFSRPSLFRFLRLLWSQSEPEADKSDQVWYRTAGRYIRDGKTWERTDPLWRGAVTWATKQQARMARGEIVQKRQVERMPDGSKMLVITPAASRKVILPAAWIKQVSLAERITQVAVRWLKSQGMLGRAHQRARQAKPLQEPSPRRAERLGEREQVWQRYLSLARDMGKPVSWAGEQYAKWCALHD